VPDEVLGLLADLRDLLQNKMEPPVYVSDRRLVKAIALLKVWHRSAACRVWSDGGRKHLSRGIFHSQPAVHMSMQGRQLHNSIHIRPTNLSAVCVRLQVSAYTNGRSEVTMQDCLLLQHLMWQAPNEAERISEWLLAQLAEGGDVRQCDYLLNSASPSHAHHWHLSSNMSHHMT
jgi:AAA lid domain